MITNYFSDTSGILFGVKLARNRIYMIQSTQGIKSQAFIDVSEVYDTRFDPFKPEFTIVIFIHYKSRIAVAILDL